MKSKQKVLRVLATAMTAVTVMTCTGITAFAAETTENIETAYPVEIDDATEGVSPTGESRQTTQYIVTNSNYFWNQGTSSALIFPEFHCDNATNINITFECIARSTNAGTFHVKLQKKGLFGIWSTISNVYTLNQHNTQSYNLRTDKYIQGAWSRVGWSVGDGGDYRVVIEDPTNPQGVELSGVYIWKRQ